MTITVTFDPPLPSDSPATFNTKAFTLLGDLNDWSTQANALPAELAVDLGAERSATATLTNKTLTTPVLTNPSYSGATANGGTVTTIDINGGTIDGAAIGSTTPAAGAFTTVTASSPITLTSANPYVSFVGTAASQQWRIGDGLNATNGNLVVYDYTGSIKALEITKATGAVTIPGALSLTGGTFGYGTGAGGTVTQATSKSTAVTLNKPCGQITMNNAALAAGGTVLFQVTNSLALSSSIVVVNANANPAGEFYSVWCSHSFAGGFFVCIRNITAVPLSDALVLNFALLTGATS